MKTLALFLAYFICGFACVVFFDESQTHPQLLAAGVTVLIYLKLRKALDSVLMTKPK